MRFDLARLLTPRAWVQNYPTSWVYDDLVNTLLDEHGITRVNHYEAKIGPLSIWTGNYPYAYASPYRSGPSVLPSLKTRRRIHDLLIKELVR